MNRDTYITRGVTEHLSNTNVYRPLNIREVDMHKRRLEILIRHFISKHRPLHPRENPDNAGTTNKLTKGEATYLKRALDSTSRHFARFRMTLKAHKVSYKMRPIVCCAGTLLNHLSKWLDFQLQKLTQFIPSYLKDSRKLLAKLKAIGLLPPNAKLFTADANSMYTNIDTDHALAVISSWIDSLSGSLPSNYPVNAVKDAMRLVMKNNIFEWGDMHFLQLLGTAMGTSAACMWATAYYGVHETTTLIPRHSTSLILYVRYIDDIFGIWTGDKAAWQAFKADINNFGILTWDINEPSTSVDFLDLTITVQPNGRLTTKTYQKAMNLYQYIPPHSAHPPGMCKGIIYSLLQNYYLQNTERSDYHRMAVLLFQRFVAVGWERTKIKSMILAANQRLSQLKHQPPSTAPLDELPSNKERLFLHLEYHPNELPKGAIQETYNHTCGELLEKRLGIKQVTIAYSRPLNLLESLTQAKLHQAPGREASTYFTGESSH